MNMPYSRNTSILMLVLPLVFLTMACDGPSQRGECRKILFSPDGMELSSPSATLFVRLEQCNASDRRKLIKELSEIVETSTGYSKLVAAKTMLTFFGEGHTEDLTYATANTLANNCIRIASMSFSETLEHLESGGSIWHPIEPKCEMWIDGDTISLCDTPLPKGWKAIRVRVFLDGKLVHDESEETDTPLALFLLEDLLPKDKYVGEHKWRSEITLVTPGDYEITISEDHAFSVYPIREYIEDPVVD